MLICPVLGRYLLAHISYERNPIKTTGLLGSMGRYLIFWQQVAETGPLDGHVCCRSPVLIDRSPRRPLYRFWSDPARFWLLELPVCWLNSTWVRSLGSASFAHPFSDRIQFQPVLEVVYGIRTMLHSTRTRRPIRRRYGDGFCRYKFSSHQA